ncbi:MAG: tetratricopeptide repeat protein [Planctomycetia bacterium]
MSTTRLQQLETLLAAAPTDTFLLYGLAMEHVKEGNSAEGLRRLKELAAVAPDYDPAFFRLGQLLAEADEPEEARAWLEKGIAAARRNGNQHALTEMEAFLDLL